MTSEQPRSAVSGPLRAGVDAGGSHSEAVVVDEDLRVLARVRGPAAALTPDSATAVARVIADLLAQTGRSGFRALVVGAAGAGRVAERTALENRLSDARLAERVRVVGDGEAAVHSVFPEGPGILLLAGTGSIAYGRGASGPLQRVGGLGWQLGDEGSGYALGRAALGAAGKAADGRGPATSLAEGVRNATGTADLDGLIRWTQAATREQVAGLARVVADAATNGDPVAGELVDHAAHELTLHVVALLRRISPGQPEALALGGGLLADESAVRTRVVSLLSRVAPRLRVTDAVVDAALGAAGLALRL